MRKQLQWKDSMTMRIRVRAMFWRFGELAFVAVRRKVAQEVSCETDELAETPKTTQNNWLQKLNFLLL